MLESGRVLAARYGLLRRLGAGRNTQVWQARDRETGEDRVLKILTSGSDTERRDFLAGARLQQQLRHPRLQACEAVHDGEPPFAVFTEVAAGDLAAWRGRPWRSLLPVLAGVAEALAALHARGVVHRDLKPANVLVGDDGAPRLADFGLAATIGDEDAPRGGSPFSMSPQQLDGAPPSTGDDVYGLGALAYELLGGYPPFYPDPDPARIRGEAPAPLPARAEVPEALESLVQRCLAKQPADRPQDMSGIEATLRTLAATASAPARAVARPVPLRPPADGAPTIAPQWTRNPETGPTPNQLRAQGFRRGLLAASFAVLLLGVGFVFFVLPRWVERNAAAPPAAPAAAAPAGAAAKPGATASPESAPDLEKLALAKRDFEAQRDSVAQRLAGFEARSAGVWGGEPFARGKRLLADADAAAGRRDYAAALATLRAADADFATTEKLATPMLREALAAGAAGLEAGDAAAARGGFERALQIDAANAVAKRGLERVATIGEVHALLAEARALEERGDAAAAEAAWRKALALDRDTRAAAEGIARLRARAGGEAFATAMSQGFDALARRDFGAARGAFERAGKIRPGSPEVDDALAQVERGLAGSSLASHVEAAQRAEREERWADALGEYRKALAVDPNLLAAQQGVERAEPRAQLDAELRTYAERPERLYSPDVRGAARVAVARARSVPQPGPVLSRQIAAVDSLIVAAETPQRVALTSDNLTDVTLYRVGRLGTFERKEVELLPGRYTVVGQRPGFRDVRREISLLPGREAPTVSIRCEEPI
ncbi:MAG: protein kinase [Solirubrobacteraceae bacterium]|nr:protein kinase [Solirubrobacteraceae bacterium]